MSELGNRDKGVYYNLLANNNATFARDSQGRIVANVRLLAVLAAACSPCSSCGLLPLPCSNGSTPSAVFPCLS